MRFGRAKVVYALVCAALVAMVAVGALSDRYLTTWKGYELTSANDVLSSDSRFADEATLEAGLFTGGPGVTLRPGRYTAIFRYDASAAGNTAQVYSGTFVDADNNATRVFAEASLPTDENEFTLAFTLDSRVTALECRTLYGGQGSLLLHSVTLKHEGLLYFTDHLFWALALAGLAAAVGVFLFGRPLPLGQDLYHRLKRLLPAAFVLGVGLFVSYPMFFDFIPRGHDMLIHMTRIEGIAEGIRAGQFPVRVQPPQFDGKGYVIGAMYPDLFMWPFALLNLAGVSLTGCYQAFNTCANVATAAIAYYAASRLFGTRAPAGDGKPAVLVPNQWVGAVFCLLYTFAAYRVVCYLLRSAAGETLAMVFLPLLALGAYEVLFRDAKRWPLLVAGATGVFQSHLINTALSAVFLLVVGLLALPRLWREKARFAALGKAAGATVLLNLWFILPLLYYYGQGLQISGMQANMWDHALYPGQLLMTLSSPRGGSMPLGTMEGEMLLGPGLPLLLCGALLAGKLLTRPRGPRDTKFARRAGIVLLVFSTVCLWATTTLFPWAYLNRIPFLAGKLDFIQFPWRLLSLTSLFLAGCGALVAHLWGPPASRRAKAAVLAALFMMCAAGPVLMMDEQLQNYETYGQVYVPALEDTFDRLYLYPGTPAVDLANLPETIRSDDDALRVWNYSKNGTTITFEYEAGNATWLEVPLTWYPGYRVVDGEGNAIPTEKALYGQMRLLTGPGGGSVSIAYTGMWWFRIGDIVSLLAVAGGGVWALLLHRRRKKAAVALLAGRTGTEEGKT